MFSYCGSGGLVGLVVLPCGGKCFITLAVAISGNNNFQPRMPAPIAYRVLFGLFLGDVISSEMGHNFVRVLKGLSTSEA